MPPRPPPRTETIRFLTLDELGRLLAVTRESVRDRAMFLLAYRPKWRLMTRLLGTGQERAAISE
jgi:hypothetical protein